MRQEGYDVSEFNHFNSRSECVSSYNAWQCCAVHARQRASYKTIKFPIRTPWLSNHHRRLTPTPFAFKNRASVS